MTRETILGMFREQGCHAFQAEFAAEFLRDGSPLHHVLISPGGLGKVATATLLARHMAVQGQARRILVVAPAASTLMWRNRLEQASPGIPVALVHSRAFRQLQEQSGGDRPAWSDSIAAIIPTDTARQPDVAESLAATCWDLVVFADLGARTDPRLVRLIARMFDRNAMKRSLVLTDRSVDELEALIEQDNGRRQALPDFHATRWSGELPDWDGTTTALPPIQWKTVPYRRDEREVRLLRMLQAKLRETKAAGSPFHFQTDVLFRRAVSSLFAAEQTLRIVNRKLSQVHGRRMLATVPEEKYNSLYEIEDAPRQTLTPEARQSYLEFLVEADAALEEVTTDGKLSCLLQLLEDLAEDQPGKICVLSAYSDTVSYLYAAISEGSATTPLATRGLPYSQRREVLRDFLRQGGILLTTFGALVEDVDLSRVRHVVHYDMPATPGRLAQVEGRFRRLDRAVPCTMYALDDLSGAV